MRLVVDANIAQSAGTSNVPVSFHSRECLNAIRDHGHIAVFCRQLLEEWGNHASLLSRQWWKSMAARRRIERIGEEEQFPGLQEKACACFIDEKRRLALAKDFHLVRAAMVTDRTILSNETDFPALLATATESVRALFPIYYANPAVETEGCILWIKAGAENLEDRRIDNWVRARGDS